MAYDIPVLDLSFAAAADYSAKQFYLMGVNTSNGRATLASTQGQKVIGVLQDDPAAATRVGSVRVLGVTKVVVGAAVTIDDELTCDSSGRAITVSADNEYIWGRALTAASTAGDVIAALVTVGGVGKATGPVVADGFIPLPLAQARELSSNSIINLAGHVGSLGADSTPILQAINAGTDQQLRLAWAASNVDVITWSTPLPPDLDDSAAVVFNAMAYMAGATDTPTLTIGAFFGIGDTNAGGATGALSATEAQVTRTIVAANVEAYPDNLTITVTPGAHGTDILYMTGAWLTYTRK